MAKGTKTKPAEDELEVLEDDEATDEAPKAAATAVTFGVSDLAKHLSKITGKEIKPRDLRTQIRRMAREENARVEREITAGNRTRYDWPKGLKDPEVKAIIAAVTGGELEEGKKAALQALKDRKAEQKAAGEGGKKNKKNKKSKVEVVEVEEVDLDDDTDDEDDD